MGLCGWILIVISYVICICTFPIAIPAGVKIVQEYERAVIFRLGRLRGKKAVGPGIFWVLPCTDEYIPVDLRTVSFDTPPQEILTKDSVTVNVDAVVYYMITNPVGAVWTNLPCTNRFILFVALKIQTKFYPKFIRNKLV